MGNCTSFCYIEPQTAMLIDVRGNFRQVKLPVTAADLMIDEPGLLTRMKNEDDEAASAGKILEGEMLRVTLSKPKNGNAQHQRVVSVVPLRSGFRSVIETLRELYGIRVGSYPSGSSSSGMIDLQ